MGEPLRIGVLGAGHLGKIHLRLLRETEGFEVVGFYDPDPAKCREAEEMFGLKAFSSIDEVIDQSQAVDIVTPTLSHYDCANRAIRASRHVFIEKPITHTPDEAHSLLKLAREADVTAQVGHVERFNPAFLAAQPYCDRPMFIEAHRLAAFNPRGTDVPVVMDLMIHDIDIVLKLVGSSVKKVSASGVPVVSDTPDIANARLEFDNGCVANLTASRISFKAMRKMRVFQRDAYIAIDFLKKKSDIVRLEDVVGQPAPDDMVIDVADGRTRKVTFAMPDVPETNAIQEELRAFLTAVRERKQPPVTLDDGYNALLVAQRIVDKMGMLPDA